MFDPNTDRSDYGKLLAPPTGYALDFAVGTTYSLDLNALVGACMSLSLGEETDSELLDNPIYILDTLHRTGEKLALFCEGGQIKVPQKVTKLHALLENIVFEVVMPKRRGTAYSSFHPKMWLLRYRNTDMVPLYRVVVLSRNLTFDRSWDVVFSMDGTLSEEQTEKNAPLKEFLAFLADGLPKTPLGKEKKRGIRSLISDLDRVRFEIKKPFTDFEFLPIGIGRTQTDIRTVLRLSSKKYDDLFVMSPFLSNGEIKALDGLIGEEAVLVTRRESLSKLRVEDCSKFKIFCIRDEVVNGEGTYSDGENETVQQQDIHAKLYLSRKYSAVDLFLGSMNASHNALAGNIEFMIHLKTLNRYLNLEKLREELFGKDEAKNPFEPIDLTTFAQEESTADSRLDKIVKAVCRTRPYANAEADGELYRVKMTVPNCGKLDFLGAEVLICPLFAARQKEISETVEFEGLPLGELTSFYRITVKKDEESLERVIIVPTEGIPASRDDAIVSSVVCDQKSFVQYLSFLLGDEPALSALEAMHSAAGNNPKAELPAALYEKMLLAAAREPARFKEIDFLMKSIRGENVVPQEFTRLYETFKKVVKINE